MTRLGIVKYYVLLALVLTAVNTTVGVIKYAPVIKNDLTELAKEVTQNFPPDLELTISPNGITANKDFPLVAQTPKALKGLPENLLIIDPNGQVGMLQEYNALMLVNNSYVIIGSGDGVQTTPLKDFPEVRVNYSKMQSLSQNLLFVAGNARLFTAGFFAISNLFDFFVVRLIYLAIFAFVLRLVYKSVLARYSQSFAISVYSVTLPLLISTTLGIANLVLPTSVTTASVSPSPPVSPFAGWFIFVHIIFAFYLLSRLEKKP